MTQAKDESLHAACAYLLGTTKIPLSELHYYHHHRPNPRAKADELFELHETSLGISVGSFDEDFARSILEASPRPLLSEVHVPGILEKVKTRVEIRHASHGVYLYADRNSFRPASPPDRFALAELPKTMVPDLGSSPGAKTFGFILDGKMICKASRLDMPDSQVSEIVSVWTDEQYRAKGLAKAAVSACVEDVLSGGRVPLYSNETQNQASFRTCRSIGFLPFASLLSVLGILLEPSLVTSSQ